MKARTKQAIRCHHVPSHALIHPQNAGAVNWEGCTLMSFHPFHVFGSLYVNDKFCLSEDVEEHIHSITCRQQFLADYDLLAKISATKQAVRVPLYTSNRSFNRSFAE